MTPGGENRPPETSKAPEKLYDGYIFDLDGTIYLGDELLPGAKRLILKLRELGRRIVSRYGSRPTS